MQARLALNSPRRVCLHLLTISPTSLLKPSVPSDEREVETGVVIVVQLSLFCLFRDPVILAQLKSRLRPKPQTFLFFETESHSVTLLGLQVYVDQTVFLTERMENCLPSISLNYQCVLPYLANFTYHQRFIPGLADLRMGLPLMSGIFSVTSILWSLLGCCLLWKGKLGKRCCHLHTQQNLTT